MNRSEISTGKYVLSLRNLLLLALVASTAVAASAAASPTLEVRITIRSECAIQRPLFGPTSRAATTITCQPGSTPFQSHAIYADDTDEQLDVPTRLGGQATDGALEAAAFQLSKSQALPTPLSSPSAPRSKVIYIIF